MEDDPVQRDPREYSWGYYAHDDIPGIGPTGMFRWFERKEEVVDHLEWLIEQYVDGENVDPEKKLAGRRILSRVRTDDMPIGRALKEINAEFEGLVQVPWWGKFEELRNGDAAFVRDVRATIRQMSFDEGLDESPINKDEEDRFIAAVRDYGY